MSLQGTLSKSNTYGHLVMHSRMTRMTNVNRKEELRKPVRLSTQQRMPMEHAIDFVENLLGQAQAEVSRAFLYAEVKRNGFPEVMPYVDQTLKVMIHHGMVRRTHPGPGCMGYERTERWCKRDDAIGLLRGPVYRKRERPRGKAHAGTKIMSEGARMIISPGQLRLI